MEKSIKPDRKYLVKATWILLTITGTFLLTAGIMHLIFSLTKSGTEAIIITWIVTCGTIFFIWIISYPIVFLWIKNLEYVIYDDRVSIHKGILTKTIQNIPFRAITDFALVRTLYDRILKIGSVKIQTAGKSVQSSGSQYEGVLGGLSDYESLHTELRTRIRSLHPFSESITTADTSRPSSDFLLQEILKELKEIRKNPGRD
jgi:uncharacterized membrane protein YdbT with pleckstrin-like domain